MIYVSDTYFAEIPANYTSKSPEWINIWVFTICSNMEMLCRPRIRFLEQQTLLLINASFRQWLLATSRHYVHDPRSWCRLPTERIVPQTPPQFLVLSHILARCLRQGWLPEDGRFSISSLFLVNDWRAMIDEMCDSSQRFHCYNPTTSHVFYHFITLSLPCWTKNCNMQLIIWLLELIDLNPDEILY